MIDDLSTGLVDWRLAAAAGAAGVAVGLAVARMTVGGTADRDGHAEERMRAACRTLERVT